MQIYNSHSECETENTACRVAGMVRRGDIIALFGGLGAGKTAFTRGLVRYFLPELRVSSPTFAIVNQYDYIYHFDMYRITGEDDLLSVGFYDYLSQDNIIIIEWFENIQQFFDEQTVEINIIKDLNLPDNRRIDFKRII